METRMERQTELQPSSLEALFELTGGWRLIPIVAALGGVWAFGSVPFGDARQAGGLIEAMLPEVAMVAALVVGGWLPLWQALAHTNWHAPFSQWREWTRVKPLPRWPYVQPGTPGDALHHRLGQARDWWETVGKRSLRAPLSLAILGALVTLLLSIVLGRLALLLSVTFVTCVELAVLWHEGRGEVGAAWSGIATAGLPWLLGATLQQETISGPAALSGLVLMLIVGFYAGRSWSAILGPIIGAAFLVWQDRPLAAGWLLLLAIPGLAVLVHTPTQRDYRKATGLWSLLMVALMALVM